MLRWSLVTTTWYVPNGNHFQAWRIAVNVLKNIHRFRSPGGILSGGLWVVSNLSGLEHQKSGICKWQVSWRNLYKSLIMWRDLLRNVGVHGRTNLKWVLEKSSLRIWTRFNLQIILRRIVRFCEQGDEPSVYVRVQNWRVYWENSWIMLLHSIFVTCYFRTQAGNIIIDRYTRAYLITTTRSQI